MQFHNRYGIGLAGDLYLPKDHEIRSAVLIVHGKRAYFCYFSRDAFARLTGDNRELLIIPDAVHIAL